VLILLMAFFAYFADVTRECRVRAAALNVRSGPGVVYDPPIHVLGNGVQFTAVGRNADTQWLLIRTVLSQQGWVNARASSVACEGNLAALPVADAPPLPSSPTTTGGSASTSDVANASKTPSANPASSGATTTINRPLDTELPRDVRFGDLVFTVNAARISSEPPTFSGFDPSTATNRIFAAIDVSVYNPLAEQSLLVGTNQVKLQLGDGRTYDEISRWSTAIPADTTQETTLFYFVPQSATWQGARLVVRMPGKEPAVLALDGSIPRPEFPMQLNSGAATTTDLVSFRIVSAALDLDNDGVRANLGERFLILTLQVLNDNTAKGNVLIGDEYFRLRVADTPLAPINSVSDVVPVRSAKRVKVVFIVPADATSADLQVGQVGGDTASMPVSLVVKPQPSAAGSGVNGTP
jgi:uncharacterized protein YraI